MSTLQEFKETVSTKVNDQKAQIKLNQLLDRVIVDQEKEIALKNYKRSKVEDLTFDYDTYNQWYR